MSADYKNIWETLGSDLAAHDALLTAENNCFLLSGMYCTKSFVSANNLMYF